MKMYEVTCRACGHVNSNLYLEDSCGWMECEECGTLHRCFPQADTPNVLAYRMNLFPSDKIPREAV